MKSLLALFRQPPTWKKHSQTLRHDSIPSDAYRVIVDLRKHREGVEEWLSNIAATTDCSIIEVFLIIKRKDDPYISEIIAEGESYGKTFRWVCNPKYAKF